MKKVILLVVLAVLLVSGAIAGTLFFTGAFSHQASADASTADGEAAPDKRESPPIYISLDPAFTVTFAEAERARFLQLKVEVATHDPDVQTTIDSIMPTVRNGLVMLFSGQRAADLETREGKEKLRKEALQEVQGILKEYTGKPGVEEVLFTSFLMQ